MYPYIKRFFDFTAALIGLILVSPILLVVIILLYFVNSGKPFYFQERPGKNGKIFTIMKLKSMNDNKDENGEFLPDLERITKIGNFVRNTSLDEIPQLLNVLKGEMSFIGPRPLLVKYLPLYNEFQRRRHDVRPGITGLAQVNGRNTISWDKRFAYDINYVENLSFSNDLKIFWLTLLKVLRRDDITTDTSSTLSMEHFNGSN